MNRIKEKSSKRSTYCLYLCNDILIISRQTPSITKLKQKVSLSEITLQRDFPESSNAFKLSFCSHLYIFSSDKIVEQTEFLDALERELQILGDSLD